MSIIGSNILAGASGQAGGGGAYEIERSVRFSSSDSAFLSRTPGTAGNRKTWTWAGWVKRSTLGTFQKVFGNEDASESNGVVIQFRNDNALQIYDYTTSVQWHKITTAVFRDASAWYHLVLAVDTTQATASNRVKLYINGEIQTSFSTSSDPSPSYDTLLNTATAHGIGRSGLYNGFYFDGYLADIHFIDGQALDPSSFTEFDDNGVLQPKAFSGSYGTNGFRLPFSDNSTAAALGTDTSSNGNTWTVNNISIITGGPTSVAAASGALPVYNTTDTYGTTKGTGTRTDSNSSSIVLAVPMDGANNGTTFTDESATIKGSGSAKTPTVNGDTKTSTALFYYYGSSGAFDGTGDCLTYASSSDFQIWSGAFTVECWFYLNSLVDNRGVFGVGNRASTTTRCFLLTRSSGNLQFDWDGWSADGSLSVSAGISAGKWYHCAVVSSGSTLTIYVNGIALGSASIGSSAQANAPLSIGAQGVAANPSTNDGINGYLQDFRVYKGVAKYTGNFNPPSSTQNATLAPGNDSLVDTPTNGSQEDTGVGGEVVGNYCTLNPLDNGGLTLANGNLDFSRATASWVSSRSTFGVSSGKWYWEVTLSTGNDCMAGISKNDAALSSYFANVANGWAYNAQNGQKYNNGAGSAYGDSWVGGNDTVGVAFDADAGSIYFYKNGIVQNSGTAAFTGLTSGPYFPSVALYGTSTAFINFGQRAFAYQTPGTNRPASTYKALCTTNLPEPTIADGSTAMDVALYTGNGSSQTISGLNFSPDFVWIKARSSAFGHGLFDIVRGTGLRLSSDGTGSEQSESGVSAFNSDGFSVGSATFGNNSSTTMVAWTWDAGDSTVTNTAGSITSQVRANASAGFSVITATTPASPTTNYSCGHGLGVTPEFYIWKFRNVASNWVVYHKSIAPYTLKLDSTAAQYTGFNMPAPSSSVINLLDSPTAAWNSPFVIYAFSPVAGYSAYGSYTGNGSADGPFIFTNFRPKLLLIKSSTTVRDWVLYDTSRSTYNTATARLVPNSSSAEGTSANIDILSNGFKIRSGSGSGFEELNESGATIVYAAWAENPFATARAR
jgi:hypothetical protein